MATASSDSEESDSENSSLEDDALSLAESLNSREPGDDEEPPERAPPELPTPVDVQQTNQLVLAHLGPVVFTLP